MINLNNVFVILDSTYLLKIFTWFLSQVQPLDLDLDVELWAVSDHCPALPCLTAHSRVLTAERSSNLSLSLSLSLSLTTRVDRKIAKQKNKDSLFYYILSIGFLSTWGIKQSIKNNSVQVCRLWQFKFVKVYFHSLKPHKVNAHFPNRQLRSEWAAA